MNATTQSGTKPATRVVFQAISVGIIEIGPVYAFVDIDSTTLERMDALKAVITDHSLSEVRFPLQLAWSDQLHDDAEVAPRFHGELVLLTNNVFYCSDHALGDDGEVQTVGVHVDQLKLAIANAAPGEPAFVTDDDSVRAAYLDDHEEVAAAQPEALRG